MKVMLPDVGNGLIVILSKRNLLALLHKVDLPEGQSHRTLMRDTEEGTIIVTAEPDADHYTNRTPGEVTPDTQDFINRYAADQAVLEGQEVEQPSSSRQGPSGFL